MKLFFRFLFISLYTILIFVLSTFLISVFMPENVLQAIDIFKGLF